MQISTVNAKSVDPSQTSHSVASDLDLHCLQKDMLESNGQGNLEKTWKVKEKSGNLKINGYGSLQKIMFCSLGKGCTFSLVSQSPSVPPHWGANSFL